MLYSTPLNALTFLSELPLHIYLVKKGLFLLSAIVLTELAEEATLTATAHFQTSAHPCEHDSLPVNNYPRSDKSPTPKPTDQIRPICLDGVRMSGDMNPMQVAPPTLGLMDGSRAAP